MFKLFDILKIGVGALVRRLAHHAAGLPLGKAGRTQ
ncbi:hypothetical protein ABID21_003496 [Pseudorhizobium tarimense]|uniref:Uncharacterized protein n=1 Tax=Pseudorhizobium tarimense TaxID=1079109 RepID=A0ABV2HA23_9HYPH